ncbi:UDP-2,3-diacylglucosamine diphosphatase [Sodalis endosymbiont of Henestaris halophilus]|uniref:UDP-2,3-diacylglucosamine diphosphatase n=1 Tax=Sodalis endosymbiont of Henestaris halophilus TaxID=1929246 RepID=UPI000BBF4F71|nr:UDP-2,3-diacylglucosamine diphosphatase [Sodalis endosymbiont of Henestaris halophilus]SNC58586.1 UDP-2,3-diacylglucosamine hydrolase [Sodalis endosymbiont of Henestaris halophilus]
MSILFVADIHLCTQEPAITAGFLYFLRTRAIAAQALYILGDLFEVWIGDDDPNPLHHEIAVALQELSQHGIPCYFIHGNRDFLLGKDYAKACGMTLLPTQQIMQFDQLKIVILHGDTLCTDDFDYQRFRRWAQHRWLQQLFLSMPLSMRLRIADRIRINSLRANAKKTVNIKDVNTQTVMTVMEHTGSTMMIHGHTHRPAIHLLLGEQRRAVLGAWNLQQGSVIEVARNVIKLHAFNFIN